MELEDNLGDIIKKGRLAANEEGKAGAIEGFGLSEADLARVAEGGKPPASLNYAGLGAAVSLDGAKLKQIAEGWRPKEVDLGVWRELRVITTASGGMAVNCYLAWDEVSREAALFDTGWEAGPILQLIDENGLTLKHIFLTHMHEDHVAALEPLRGKFPKAHLHTNARSAPPQHRNRPNDFLQLGSLRITNRDTPGHAEEGVTYIIGTWPDDAPHVAVVGDAIFAASMGRGNQSWKLARQKVREQILSLPPDTLICPGHGPLTTVSQEKAHNPFF